LSVELLRGQEAQVLKGKLFNQDKPGTAAGATIEIASALATS
jgi:hypothetical protein